MKRVIFGIFAIAFAMIASAQSPTKGALNTVDTTFKPAIKMLAVNRLDNSIVFWDQRYWSTIAVNGIGSSNWSLTGNAGTTAGTNFIGTTDAVDFVLKTNNIQRIRVNSSGALGLGSSVDYGSSTQVIQSSGSSSPPTWKYPSAVGVYNVFNYGATGDGVIISDASITSGSANLTTSTTVFTSADIGKYIQVQAAGTGGYAKVFTITAVGSANSITLNTTAGATVSNGVAKYGTDQTAFIQAAIDAAVANYSGTVYLPRGIYILAGALQSPSNSQLTFPFVDNPTTYAGHSVQITMQGEGCGGKETTVLATTVPSSSGTTLLSFAIGSGSFPSVMATRTVNTTQYTYIDLTVRDMNIQVIGNTSTGAALCGINGGNFINFQVQNINVQVDVPLVSSILPTNNYAAIIFTQYGFASVITSQDIQISGFKYGAIVGEHFKSRNTQIFGCYYGYGIGTSGGHPTDISGLIQWCANGVSSKINYPTGTALGSNWVYGDVGFEGLNQGVRWYNYQYAVKDTANFLRGKINFKFTTSSLGTPTTFAKDGGSNLQCIPLTTFIATNVNGVNADVDGGIRLKARVGSTTSSGTPTINTDNVDIYKLTAQAVDITSFTTNLSGTPNDGDVLEIQVTGTAARAITWGASFVSSTVTLPTTTVTTTTLTIKFQYYTTSSYGNNKWVCVNSY